MTFENKQPYKAIQYVTLGLPFVRPDFVVAFTFKAVQQRLGDGEKGALNDLFNQ